MTPTFDAADYIDITHAAGRTSIRDRAYSDSRLLATIRQEIDFEEFKANEGYEPIVPLVLIPLRFLMGRFPSMTSFHFTAGPTNYFRQSLPIIATFQQDESGAYFWAMTLDVEVEARASSRAEK